MVHTLFDPAQVRYDEYIQTGGGSEGATQVYDYFRGPMFQRGYGLQRGAGIADLFRGAWRFFLPLIRKAGMALSDEALNTGQRVLEQIKEGQPLKSALINEGKRGADAVLARSGLPKQFGTGKRGIKRKSSILSHQTIIGRAITKPIAQSKKRLRSDAFGLY